MDTILEDEILAMECSAHARTIEKISAPVFYESNQFHKHVRVFGEKSKNHFVTSFSEIRALSKDRATTSIGLGRRRCVTPRR